MKTIPLIVTILVAWGYIQALQAAQPSAIPTPSGSSVAPGLFAAQPQAESAGGGISGRASGFGGASGGFGGGAAAVQPGAVPSTDLYGSGLLSEEGDQDLHAAEAAYRQAIQQFDRQREGAANAIFRLGEVYRKMGRSEEAKVQYARILREFPDMVHLTELSHARLIGDAARIRSTGRTGPTRPIPPADAATVPSAERDPGYYDRLMMERYGLLPGRETLSPATPEGSIDPVLLQRYGLGAGPAEQAQLNTIINRLRQIDGAKQQWALEKRQPQDARPTMEDVAAYIRGGFPAPIAGERYEINAVGEPSVAILTQPLGNRKPGDRITIGPPDQLFGVQPMEPVRIHVREDGGIELDGEPVELNELNDRLRQIARGRRSVAVGAEDQAPPESVMAVVNAAFDPRLSPLEVDGPARTLIQREAARWTDEIADLERKVASLGQESHRLFTQGAMLTRELREAEERVEPARQRLHASESNPERLPGMISQDERYQKLRAEYEAAVLDGDEEPGKRARARLSQWVEQIYRPELEAELEFAWDTVHRIRSDQEALEARRQRVVSQHNQMQDQLAILHQRRAELKAMVPDLEAEP